MEGPAISLTACDTSPTSKSHPSASQPQHDTISRKRSCESMDEPCDAGLTRVQLFASASRTKIYHIRSNSSSSTLDSAHDVMWSSEFAVGQGKKKPRWMEPDERRSQVPPYVDLAHERQRLRTNNNDAPSDQEIFTPLAGASVGMREDDPRVLRDVLGVMNYFDGFCASADPRMKIARMAAACRDHPS